MKKIDFSLSFQNRDIPDEDVINDLIELTFKLNKKITYRDYNKYGKYSAATIVYKFGSWNQGLEKAGLSKNIEFNQTNEDLFDNLKELWITIERQPTYRDCKKPKSKFNASIYEYRFGSWKKALEAFVEYVNQENSEDRNEEKENEINSDLDNIKGIIIHKTKRDISERMRFRILLRDGFRCHSCGRSPITSPGVELHIDHIIPWSKGGETIDENLQCKCKECNLGKGNAFDQ